MIGLYNITAADDGPEAIYAAHNEAEAVRAFVHDQGPAANVRATLIPPAKVLRVIVDVDKGSVVEMTARELAADAKPGQLVVAGGVVCVG